MRLLPYLLLLSLLLQGCRPSKGEEESRSLPPGNQYATNFQLIVEEGECREIKIIEEWSGKKLLHSYPIVKGESLYQAIEIPLKRVICMSSSHLPYLSLLGVEESLKGISGANYISDSLFRAKVASGEIVDIGFEGSLNFELVLQLQPDLLISYGISDQNNLYLKKLRDAGIKVLALGDYQESHPLGKLEYIKLFGVLYGKEREADSIYNSIKELYLESAERVANIANRKKVLLNAPWKEVWYIPGSENYISTLIREAGGEVVLARKGERGSFPFSTEEIALAIEEAEIWLHPNLYNSLKELKELSPLIGSFHLIEEGKVFNNTKRVTVGGGSDFWERGAVEPHLILNDLITILHSKEIKEEELVYYKLLK